MSNQVSKTNPFEMMGSRLSMEPAAVESLMRNTLMRAKGRGEVSNEELAVFMSIANEYKLNPLSKEIYAFNNRGAIQPIVSVDGWLKIINGHPQFDGMEFVDHTEGGHLVSVTCRIYRKDRSRATEVTEYMDECKPKSSEAITPWERWPARMLRHKATIQAARYAFGLSGIIDPDEADRIKSATIGVRDITPQQQGGELPPYSDETLSEYLPRWQAAIESGRTTPERIIAMIQSKNILSEEQKQAILSFGNAEPVAELEGEVLEHENS